MLKVVHISSEANRISDCLSRWDKLEKQEQFWALMNGRAVQFMVVNLRTFEFSHEW